MIKARHTYVGVKFFNLYSAWLLRLYFRKVQYKGNIVDEGKPVLVISNHFSWFDGFIQLQLNNKFLFRKYHIMMLEGQLRKHLFLRAGGCFSISKGKKGVVESLKYSIDILRDKKNLLVLFPQGEIQSMHTQPLEFEKGIGYILKELGDTIQVVFNVNLVDYHSRRKPVLRVYFKTYTGESMEVEALQDAFSGFMEACKQQQNQS